MGAGLLSIASLSLDANEELLCSERLGAAESNLHGLDVVGGGGDGLGSSRILAPCAQVGCGFNLIAQAGARRIRPGVAEGAGLWVQRQADAGASCCRGNHRDIVCHRPTISRRAVIRRVE